VHLTLGDSVAYKLFQMLIEESNRAVHGSGEVFGDVVVVAIAGVQVNGAVCIAVLPRQTTSVTNGN
jgi:hypothetical protein